MSETLDPVAIELDQRQLAEQLLAQAKEQGVELVGPNGLLNQLTKNVLETALDAEMTKHLAMTSTIRSAGAAAILAMARGPRPCSPRSARWKSRCRAIPTAPLSRRSLTRSCVR